MENCDLIWLMLFSQHRNVQYFLTILVTRSLASFWISPNANSNHTLLLIRDYSWGLYKVWDEFIHPFSNLYKSFHPTFQRVCDQLSMMGLKLIHVSEGTPVHRIITSLTSASTRYTIARRHGPSRWLASPFAQAQIRENIQAPRHSPLRRESAVDRWIPLIKDQ